MPTRALVVLTAVLLLSGLTAGAASASERVLHDPAGDMWRADFTGETQPAPHTRAGDVRRASFRHGPKNIVIRQRFVDLRRIGKYAAYYARIQNGAKDRYREVQVEARRGSWRGKIRVFDRRGAKVACAATHRIDYAKNTLVIKVPRSCLATPRLVRATTGNAWAQRRDQVFLLDNPHTKRASAPTWTRWVRSA